MITLLSSKLLNFYLPFWIADHILSIFWLIHSDLHEPRASTALEYISTMVASLEPMVQSNEGPKNPENLYWLEQNTHQGKFHVRLKQRNGRVKLLVSSLSSLLSVIFFVSAKLKILNISLMWISRMKNFIWNKLELSSPLLLHLRKA